LVLTSVRAIDWPQWLGPQRDGVWRETGLMERFPDSGLKAVWRTPVGTGYAGPAVANGRVYVMDRHRKLGPDGKPVPPAGRLQPVPGYERVLCLSADNGKQLWEHQYECGYVMSYGSGPRTTPVVENGKVYTLGGMGDMKCLDAETGKVQWEKSLPKEYHLKTTIDLEALKGKEVPAITPVWGYASHLLIDGDLLYSLVGGPGTAVVAFNKNTGKEVWRALSANEVGYAPPMIYTIGGTRQLIVWLDETVNGLDPASGKVYWTVKHPGVQLQRPAVTIHTPKVLGDKLFLSTFYNGSVVIQVSGGEKPAARVVWKSKSDNPAKPEALHIMMSPPILKDGHIYGICAFGELRCLRMSDGREIWNTLAATLTKKQYERAEKRLKAAMSNGSPEVLTFTFLFNLGAWSDLFSKPKMRGVDCGNCYLIPLGDGNRYVLFNDQGELILAEISPGGYHEVSRAKLIEPDHAARNREVVWSHPAFANKCVYARNDKELICVPLGASN